MGPPPVPSPENELHGSDPPEEYQNGVWFRRTVDAPAPTDRERVRLVFAAVSSVADVWVNGRWVGYHEGGYSPFVLDVTDAMLGRPGPLTIAVRIDNPPLGPPTCAACATPVPPCCAPRTTRTAR